MIFENGVERYGEVRCAPSNRNRKVIAFFGFLFIIATVFACAEQKSTRNGIVIADSSSYEATIFKQNCAICHGKEAYGKMVDGKMVPSLRFGDAAKKTEKEIYQQIAHGKLPMPSFNNQLTEKEIRGMVRFIIRDLQAREIEKSKD